MNWKAFTAAMGVLIILPLSTYAANTNEINQIKSANKIENNMGYLTQRPKHRGRNRGEKMTKLLQQLDLSSEQSQQVKTIREQSQSAAQGLKEQLQTQRETMRSLLASDAVIEEIRAEHQQTQELRQQLGNNRFETMLQIREVLTPEQRSQLAELIEQHQGRRHDG